LLTSLVNSEFDGIHSSLGPKVVHASLEALLPREKVHGGELGGGWGGHEDVEALALVNVRGPIGGHVDDGLLGHLPSGLVELLDVLRNFGNRLNGAVVRNDLVAHRVVPEPKVSQILE